MQKFWDTAFQAEREQMLSNGNECGVNEGLREQRKGGEKCRMGLKVERDLVGHGRTWVSFLRWLTTVRVEAWQ